MAVAKNDFKCPDSCFPLVRASLVAANLSSPKQKDGISRLLVPSDIEKIKGAKSHQKMMPFEKLLQMNLDTLLASPKGVLDKDHVKLLARFMVRSALLLVKKEGKGRESKQYGSLQDINMAFLSELLALDKRLGEKAARDAGVKLVDIPVPEGEPASGSAGPDMEAGQRVLSLQDANNPKTMAELQYPWLVAGQHYLKKDQKQIHVFEKMTGTNGVFAVVDLHGLKQVLEVPHKDLRFFRHTDKKPETVLEMTLVKSLQVEQSAEWLLELEKADVQAAILRNYQERGQLDLTQALYTSEHKLRAGKKIKQGSCKIFPFGSVSRVKPGEKLEKMNKKLLVKVSDTGNYYQVQASRVDLLKGQGALPTFFWVAGTEEEEDANLEVSEYKYESWLTIPYYKAKVNIDQGAKLCYLKPSDPSAGPAKKKAKTG